MLNSEKLLQTILSSRVAVFCLNSTDLCWLKTLIPRDQLLIYSKNGLDDEVEYVRKSQVAENNAEVIILSGPASAAIINRRRYRHAKKIILPMSSFLNPVVLLGFCRYIFRHLRFDGLLKIDRGQYVSFSIMHGEQRPYRLWLNGDLGYMGLIRMLNNENLSYVVLRWHEQLPFWIEGDDLDILASDQSALHIRNLLNSKIGNLPIDLYAVSGGDVTGGDAMAYFPPVISDKILAQAIVNPVGVKVPSPEDDYYSLLYHVVYHKGFKSGLKSSEFIDASNDKAQDNKFTISLALKAKQIGQYFAPSLEESESALAVFGWRPPRDMLIHFAMNNNWLKIYLSKDEVPVREGFCVFILREIVYQWSCEDEIISQIESSGFVVLDTYLIPEEHRISIGSKIRGGNWSRGNGWPMDGGGPALFVSAYDSNPIKPTNRDVKSSPAIKNARLLFKRGLRKLINDSRPFEMRANFIHTSDNSREALDYADIVLPQERKLKINEALVKFGVDYTINI